MDDPDCPDCGAVMDHQRDMVTNHGPRALEPGYVGLYQCPECGAKHAE